MTDQERYRYETFLRERQFGIDNAADFPSDSVGGIQFVEISAVIDLIEQYSTDQAAGFGSSGFAFSSKETARENLREAMFEIVRTARSMIYQFPGITEIFRMPRNQNDANMLAAANAFITAIPTYKTDFVAYGLPFAFDTQLQNDIDAYEASLPATGTAIDERVKATAELGAAIRRGMIAHRILKGVVSNRYRNDVGKLAAWISASHIERAPKKPASPNP